jgi:hypothetical protein
VSVSVEASRDPAPSPEDREIYVRGVDPEALGAWLAEALGVPLAARPRGRGLRLDGRTADGAPVEVLLVTDVPDRFVGVWCRSGPWPWPDDLALARAAREALGAVVRCTAGAWSEHAPEDERFWQLDEQGERTVPWRS